MGNIKGIICPKFSLIWTFIAAIYYFFLATPLIDALKWFSNNLAFSFILGVFFGVFIIDYVYSTKIYFKIKKYAKEENISVKLEELRNTIKEIQQLRKEKYSFLFSLKQTKPLKEYLDEYNKKINKKKKKLHNIFRKK